MKTTKFFTTILAAMALTACSNEETINEGANDRVALQVTSGIQTRAIGSNWQKDDAIGIYMYFEGSSMVSELARNRKYTTATDGSSNTFTATDDQIIYFPVNGDKVDFFAYYPHQTQFDIDDCAVFDVSNQNDQPKIDLMTDKLNSTAEAPLDKNNPRVALKFNHRMTKIELNIAAGTGLKPEDLAGLKVEITNQRTDGLFNPELNIQSLNLLTGTKTVTMLTAADGLTSSAILLPNNTENQIITGRQLVFTLTTGEKFYWAIPDTKEFKAGDRNIYNITINRSGVQVTATIEDWNNGNGETGENGSAE